MTSTAATTGVRAATAADAEAIADIYNEAVAERSATFDTAPVSAADAAGWLGGAPLLVTELDGRVAGWARAIASTERCALAGVGEYAIYVAGAARGRGVGRRLLRELVNAAETAGLWKLQGRMFTTNAASIALARAEGFREVGVYERHGRLDGEWKDLLIVERLLGDAARD